MIELKNVTKFYNNSGTVALGLRNISLKLNRGEIVAIVGDSGSGKSTLLNVITGVDTYEEGEIYFEGNETSYFNQNDMDLFRKQYVSFIFQNYNIIDSYTVLQNVVLPLLLSGKTMHEAEERALEIIAKVGLTNRIKHKGSKLSGGEKQRCVIARALASESPILACDEPTGNLDSKTGKEIIQLIKDVAEDKLVLIVSHNYDQIKDIVTRRIKISDGEIVEDYALQELPAQEEKNQEMHLEENKTLKKTFFRLAFQNIINTPKKTIFSSLVFIAISFIALVLTLLLFQYSYEIGYSMDQSYNNVDRSRIIAYDEKNKALNTSLFDGVEKTEMYHNAFYEERSFYIRSESGKGGYNVFYSQHKFENTLISGKALSDENECFLVLPSTLSQYDHQDYINMIGWELQVSDATMALSSYIGKLVGVGISDSVRRPYLQTFEDCSIKIRNITYHQEIRGYYEVDGSTYSLGMTFNSEIDKSYISVPLSLKNDEDNLSFNYAGIYPCTYDVEIVFEKSDQFMIPTLVRGKDYLNGELEPIFSGVYETTIYSSNIERTKNQIERLNLKTAIPTRLIGGKTVFNITSFYAMLAFVLVALVCLYFISYIILARVYASKNKDYGVLRTLGMVRKKMGRIVLIETCCLGLISSIISLIIFWILHATTQLFPMGAYVNFGIVLLYLLVMMVFSLLIGQRFNQRLFKFSVNTTLKGEVARND